MQTAPTNFRELIDLIVGLIELTLPVLVGLALLAFLWGLVKFIYRVGGDEKAVTDGKNLMLWGLIALFILVSLMGIIAFFQSDLGLTGPGPYLPTGPRP